jgi:nicotinate-nucleotide adenylyltransferase
LNTPKKIGILGGTFDPPHLGHLKLATHFSKLLELDQLLLIPSGQPWQKSDTITSAQVRLNLTEAAAIDLARAFLYLKIPTQIGVDQIEIDRAGPSYAIDTALVLRERYGKNANLIWLMGADSLIQLPSWRSWQDLLNQVNIAVASRPHHNLQRELSPEIAQLLKNQTGDGPQALENQPYGHIFIDNSLSIDLSSTELRNQLKTSSRTTVASEQIPTHAFEIITNLGLYQ